MLNATREVVPDQARRWISFVGFLAAPVGAILGHVSLSQVRDRGETGRGLDLAGAIIGWSVTAVVIAGIVVMALLATPG